MRDRFFPARLAAKKDHILLIINSFCGFVNRFFHAEEDLCQDENLGVLLWAICFFGGDAGENEERGVTGVAIRRCLCYTMRRDFAEAAKPHRCALSALCAAAQVTALQKCLCRHTFFAAW